MDELLRRLRYYFRRRQFEAELDEEMRHHLALSGRKHFGNVTLLKEDSRTMWTWTFWEQLGQDLRYALRTMVNNKTFTALATLSLAMGIGANTAIYSFTDSILLRSLPVQNPEALVMLNTRSQPFPTLGQKEAKKESVMHFMMQTGGSSYNDPKTGFNGGVFPFPAFELLQRNDSIFSSLFAHYPWGNMNLIFKGQAGLAAAEYVSGDFFRGLGVPPATGRLIFSDDDKAGAPLVAVVSYGFSQRRLGGAVNAVGESILINKLPFTVVGVTPPEFFGVDPAMVPDFYIPMHANLLLDDNQLAPIGKRYLDQNAYWIEIMGRLRSGVSLTQAQSALASSFHQWVLSTATNDGERADLPALVVKEGAAGLDSLRRSYSKPLYVLMTLVGLILAIACANIANLLLARATARRREMAVRLSMGAGRLRVVRQLLTESILLASLGGALGVLFAVWGIRFLTVLLVNGRDNFTLRAGLNWHVLAATVALSLLTGVLFGLAPAIQSTRVDVMPALKEARGSEGKTRVRCSFLRVSLSQVLVVSQIAISLLMLVAAGLFVRTLSNLQAIELGFNRENMLLFNLNVRQAGYGDPEIASFYADLQKRFAAIPGVRNAGISNTSPVGGGRMGLPIRVPGLDQFPLSTAAMTVGPSFFATMQIPILLGRDIEERDQPGSASIAVVNEMFAKSAFGDENPLGRHITLGGVFGVPKSDMEIVGVCKNARYGSMKDDFLPIVYFPYNQGSFPPVNQMTYELRTAGDPLAVANTVREIVHQADSRVPVYGLKTEDTQIDQTINQEITFAKLCSAFALLALIIACVGLYGTMAYTVARRTNEIGIRMALGAQRGRIVGMVLREVVTLAVAGLAIGLPAAYAGSRLIDSFLFGMRPNDPLAMWLAVVTLLAAAITAGYAPARRASRIDPMVALRHE
jgi:macrolide transport system ATP-binding/permease protein